MCNYDLELIGYATDDTETKSFDQIKQQQYSTQSVDRIYRLGSTSFILIQLNLIVFGHVVNRYNYLNSIFSYY